MGDTRYLITNQITVRVNTTICFERVETIEFSRKYIVFQLSQKNLQRKSILKNNKFWENSKKVKVKPVKGI